jgi:hypothetical protein
MLCSSVGQPAEALDDRIRGLALWPSASRRRASTQPDRL